MDILYCLRNRRRSATLKISLLILLLTVIMFVCAACTASPSLVFTDKLSASYAELLHQGDFSRMRYDDNILAIYYTSDEEPIVLPSEEYPQTTSLFTGRDVKSIYKRNGDVYYITSGLLDCYRGYIISEDSEIDMAELLKLKRILTPCPYYLFYFSSEY